MKIFTLTLMLLCTTTCAVYNVIPDDDYDHYYPNTSCHHCHTLQYYQLNTAKYFTSNSQLLFYSRLHHLHSDLIIENVYNISFVGTNSNTSAVIDCNSSGGLVFKNITHLVIENIVIKNCQNQQHTSYQPAVIITDCNFVKLSHVYIQQKKPQMQQCKVSLLGINILGNSSLDHLKCNKPLILQYNEANVTVKHQRISLNNFSIEENYFNSAAALNITLNQSSYTLTVEISNTVAKNYFLSMQSSYACAVKCNEVIINQCQLKYPHGKVVTARYSLLIYNVGAVYFNNCQIANYYRKANILIESKKVTFSYCIFYNINASVITVSSNITIEHCAFVDTHGCILKYNKFKQPQPVTVIIKNTTFNSGELETYLLSFAHTELLLIGPVKFHRITTTSAYMFYRNSSIISIIKMWNCSISVYGHVEFLYNKMHSLIGFQCITEDCFTMNIADNASLIIADNTVGTYFYAHWPDPYLAYELKYWPCFFQYLNENRVHFNGPVNYSISFSNNTFDFFKALKVSLDEVADTIELKGNLFNYRLPLSHCYWLPHSVFTTNISLDVNEKYVKFVNNSKGLPKMKTIELLCYCDNDTHYDCYKEDLGFLYPGKTAAVPLCYPLADKYMSGVEFKVIADESITINQTHFAPCTVYNANETIQLASKNCTTLYYTIAFLTDRCWCELLLKVPFGKYMKYQIFYVRELPCPLGFIKKDGICQCYPLFNQFGITDCDINKQSVLRPASSWIYASNQDNYIISEQCPFPYCKGNAFYLNLSTPEVQCQFNRSGLLCGQCQHGLSAVFGSSHCQHCSNIYLLLIIPIAIAGFVLVLLLFLLNLTVTDGIINAFIIYANIISVNSTVFFPRHNYQQTELGYVFISLANLDLGIETCFYNGMDDYAKMWLQLGFPFYLILIATLLIITSRYSIIIQKITSHRALPVLATLFLLSYTKILRTVCDVLFLYSSVTYLPSKHTSQIWSIDANVPLFGVKFFLLFIACLILFLILIPFNLILLFTRTLSRFKFVNKFKPLLDAYQGPYKIKFYYWTGQQLMVRTVFFGLSSLSSNINLSSSIIILSIANVVHTCSKPFKSKIKNYQEFLLIINLLVLYIVALSSAPNDINANVVNIMISLAVAQFSLIVMYNTLIYACSGVLFKRLSSLYYDILARLISKSHKKMQTQPLELHHCNIPDVTYNYREYQEPLIGQEYHK